MTTIDIFSRIELPSEQVFNYLLNPHTLYRCSSPFFQVENFNLENSKINTNSSFSQKCVFLDILQLYYNAKEIIPNEKLSYEFNGLIKGSQIANLISDGKSCILKEQLSFSLYNDFNFPIVNILLSILFYMDIFIKHLRLKSLLYKECSNGRNKKSIFGDFGTIRSYIVIESDLGSILSLFEDLNKFSLWLPNLLQFSTSKNNKANDSNEFCLEFLLPILPKLSCKITKEESNKITISFSNPLFSGKNIWAIFPCENKFVIENTIEIDEIIEYIKLFWILIGNTLIKYELGEWNKRLKEVVGRKGVTSGLRYVENEA